jgi:hypothetical protein
VICQNEDRHCTDFSQTEPFLAFVWRTLSQGFDTRCESRLTVKQPILAHASDRLLSTIVSLIFATSRTYLVWHACAFFTSAMSICLAVFDSRSLPRSFQLLLGPQLSARLLVDCTLVFSSSIANHLDACAFILISPAALLLTSASLSYSLSLSRSLSLSCSLSFLSVPPPHSTTVRFLARSRFRTTCFHHRLLSRCLFFKYLRVRFLFPVSRSLALLLQ